ncbi:hypothetical protein D1BOALGB6SA_9785 [Olavius sp. associated proteobacterium Delta 1]|nr:hypothetical protein D1BOALGB6SA_9785 [Olavius sp. associated proteobacterium Delta 1]
MSNELNTILFPRFGSSVPLDARNLIDLQPKMEYFEFLLEELLSMGVGAIALEATAPLAERRSRLPKAIQNRIIVVDRNANSFERAQAFFKPISQGQIWDIVD